MFLLSVYQSTIYGTNLAQAERASARFAPEADGSTFLASSIAIVATYSTYQPGIGTWNMHCYMMKAHNTWNDPTAVQAGVVNISVEVEGLPGAPGRACPACLVSNTLSTPA